MRLKPLVLIIAVSTMIVSGCRSYGGYGSEEALYEHAELMIQRFSEDLDRARADLSTLGQAATDDPRLAQLAEQFGLMVEGHAAILDEQRGLLDDLSPESSHRALHRAHGAIMARQRTVHKQRAELLRTFSQSLTAESAAPSDTSVAAEAERPYALIPPYYDRTRSGQEVTTITDLVRRVRTDGGEATEPGSPSPQTDADTTDAGQGDADNAMNGGD